MVSKMQPRRSSTFPFRAARQAYQATIPRILEPLVMPVQTDIQVTDSVRHTVGKRYPG
jgi:hypothetical protein